MAIRLFKVDLGKRPIRPPYVNFRLADTDIMQFGGKKAQMKRSHWTAEEQKRHMGSAMAIATTANLLLGLRWTDIGRDYTNSMVAHRGMDKELCEAGTEYTQSCGCISVRPANGQGQPRSALVQRWTNRIWSP